MTGQCYIERTPPETFYPNTRAGEQRHRQPPPEVCTRCTMTAACEALGRGFGANGWWGGVYLQTDKVALNANQIGAQDDGT